MIQATATPACLARFAQKALINEVSMPGDAVRCVKKHLKLSPVPACRFAVLAASNLIRIGISIPAGLFTDRVLEICLYTLPFFVLALWIGDKVISRMDERYYTSAVYMILAGSLILLISNVMS